MGETERGGLAERRSSAAAAVIRRRKRRRRGPRRGPLCVMPARIWIRIWIRIIFIYLAWLHTTGY